MFTFDGCTIHLQGLNTPFLLAEHMPTFGWELLAYNLLLLFVETQQGHVLLAQMPHDSCVRVIFLNYLGVWWLWCSWRTNLIGQTHLFSEVSQSQFYSYILLLQAIKLGLWEWGCTWLVKCHMHAVGTWLVKGHMTCWLVEGHMTCWRNLIGW